MSDRARLEEAHVRTMADAEDIVARCPEAKRMLDACYWTAHDGAITVAEYLDYVPGLVAWMRRALVEPSRH